jgi:hypothetical protein
MPRQVVEGFHDWVESDLRIYLKEFAVPDHWKRFRVDLVGDRTTYAFSHVDAPIPEVERIAIRVGITRLLLLRVLEQSHPCGMPRPVERTHNDEGDSRNLSEATLTDLAALASTATRRSRQDGPP